MNNLEIKIKEKLIEISDHLCEKGITEKEFRRRLVWTRAIKTALTELAYEEFNFSVYTSPNDYDDTTNECMYDMLWYEPLDGHINDINLIHLALESEWDTSFLAIKYDFYK